MMYGRRVIFEVVAMRSKRPDEQLAAEQAEQKRISLAEVEARSLMAGFARWCIKGGIKGIVQVKPSLLAKDGKHWLPKTEWRGGSEPEEVKARQGQPAKANPCKANYEAAIRNKRTEPGADAHQHEMGWVAQRVGFTQHIWKTMADYGRASCDLCNQTIAGDGMRCIMGCAFDVCVSCALPVRAFRLLRWTHVAVVLWGGGC